MIYQPHVFTHKSNLERRGGVNNSVKILPVPEAHPKCERPTSVVVHNLNARRHSLLIIFYLENLFSQPCVRAIGETHHNIRGIAQREFKHDSDVVGFQFPLRGDAHRDTGVDLFARTNHIRRNRFVGATLKDELVARAIAHRGVADCISDLLEVLINRDVGIVLWSRGGLKCSE